MFRLFGFIVGSIASIAALVMLVGTPSFHVAGEAIEDDRFDVVIQQLKDKQQTASEASVAAEPAPLAETPAATDADVPIEAVAQEPAPVNAGGDLVADREAIENPETLFMQAPADLAPHAPGPDNEPSHELPTENPAIAEAGWQSFWNPFRSEIAANGFVRRLENVTGLDYRVVKIKNGVYEVAFSYHDDDERSSKLTQIAAATGLDLSDTGL